MSGLIKVREELHNRMLRDRSIELLLLKPGFEVLWKDSTKEQQEEVTKYIQDSARDKLIKWMDTHPSIDLGEKTIRQLIPIAQRLCIKNYSRMGRDDLILAIKELTDGPQ